MLYKYRIVKKRDLSIYSIQKRRAGFFYMFDAWSFCDADDTYDKAVNKCLTFVERDKRQEPELKILRVFNP